MTPTISAAWGAGSDADSVRANSAIASARAADAISSTRGGSGSDRAKRAISGRVPLIRQASDEAAQLGLIFLDRGPGAGDLALDDFGMLAQVPIEVLPPLGDPGLRLPAESLGLGGGRLAHPAHILLGEAPEFIGFGRRALPDAFDMGVEAVGRLRRDPLALTVDGRLHAVRDLAKERGETTASVWE